MHIKLATLKTSKKSTLKNIIIVITLMITMIFLLNGCITINTPSKKTYEPVTVIPITQLSKKVVLDSYSDIDPNLWRPPLYEEYKQGSYYLSEYYNLAKGQEVDIILDADVPIIWSGNPEHQIAVGADFWQVLSYDEEHGITGTWSSSVSINKLVQTNNGKRAEVNLKILSSDKLLGMEPLGKGFFKLMLANGDRNPHVIEYTITIR